MPKKIPAKTAAAVAMKEQLPESMLARALLSSKVEPRAKVMCPEGRHRLAAVYITPDGVRYLVTPRRTMMAKSVFAPDASSDAAREVVFVDWAFKLSEGDPDESTLQLRCHCGMFWTSQAKVLDQLTHLPAGDDWLMCGSSRPADDAETVRQRESG